LAWATRLAFIGMVGIGTGLVLLGIWYWLRRRRNGPGPEDRFTLMALTAAGPLAFLANELGWLVSEFGRQPWVVYGVFRTANAITTAQGLGATFAGFTVLCLVLSAVTVWGVRRVSTGSPEPLPGPIVSVA
jgi:cytochrome bd ubiquinol oxidase subunit I